MASGPVSEVPLDRYAALRRVHALVRDEGLARNALKTLEDERADLDAFTELADRTRDLLETVQRLRDDDDFWRSLSREPDPPTQTQLDDARKVLSDGLPPLLLLFGYQSPPPPPVEELVADTQDALRLALGAGDGRGWELEVAAARSAVASLLYRVRRQVSLAEHVGPAAAKDLVGTTQHLTAFARTAMPIIAAASAGALAETLVPGSGIIAATLGTALGTAAAEAVEQAWPVLSQQVEDGWSVLSRGFVRKVAWGGKAPSETLPEEPPGGTAHPFLVHSTGLIDALSAVDHHDPACHHMGRIRRHIVRLGTLAADAGLDLPELHQIEQLMGEPNVGLEQSERAEATRLARNVQASLLDAVDRHRETPFGSPP